MHSLHSLQKKAAAAAGIFIKWEMELHQKGEVTTYVILIPSPVQLHQSNSITIEAYFDKDQLLVGGWATPPKNMKVSWDD